MSAVSIPGDAYFFIKATKPPKKPSNVSLPCLDAAVSFQLPYVRAVNCQIEFAIAKDTSIEQKWTRNGWPASKDCSDDKQKIDPGIG